MRGVKGGREGRREVAVGQIEKEGAREMALNAAELGLLLRPFSLITVLQVFNSDSRIFRVVR